MDTPKKDKVKHRFSPAEAADYLRQLADALEQGHIALRSEELELEGEVKVKEALKTKSGKATLKVNLKIVAPAPETVAEPAAVQEESPAEAQDESSGFVEITSPEEEPPQEGEGKASYKKTKKALGKSFGNLKEARKQDQMPPAEEAAAFLNLARQMCDFDKAKYGSENYPRFLAAVDSLEAALAAGDAAAVDQTLAELGQCKSECHDKYK